MPYIPKIVRDEIDREQTKPGGPGTLNYKLSRIIHLYIERFGQNYNTLSECIGALECAKLELYRRVLGPYEDKKIAENGDLLPKAPIE